MSDTHIPWKWTRRFAVGLTISVAAFSAWGALAPHIAMPADAAPMAAGVLMAALYGNSQGLANCMAANARRAWERGRNCRLPAAFFTACFVGFALLSMSGLHSAWEYVKTNAGGAPLPDDTLMRALFWFVAFSEPAMNYGVEALKSLQKAEERADERETLDAAAEREIRRRDAEERRKAFHAVAAPAAAVAVAAAPAMGDAEASHPEFPLDPASHSAPEDTAVEAHRAHGWRGPRDEKRWARFVEAHELGLSGAEIIRETGLPSTTVYRWIAVLGVGTRDSHMEPRPPPNETGESGVLTAYSLYTHHAVDGVAHELFTGASEYEALGRAQQLMSRDQGIEKVEVHVGRQHLFTVLRPLLS